MSQKVVAIVGASTDPAKFGNKAVRAYLRQGWKVYPVTPKDETIEGLTPVRSVADVPEPIDRVVFYLPPAAGMKVLADVAAKGTDELFISPGAESDELLAEARRLGLQPIQACAIVSIGERP